MSARKSILTDMVLSAVAMNASKSEAHGKLTTVFKGEQNNEEKRSIPHCGGFGY
jgi:uncharacterized protein (DUF2141 family)